MSDVTLTYGINSIELPNPNLGYITNINMPLDFTYLDDGTVDIYDEGEKYDKRMCEAVFFLPANDNVYLQDICSTQEEVNLFLRSTARGKTITMTIETGSGFYPFGVDKGNTGPFSVIVEFIGTPLVQEYPFRFFQCKLRFINVNDYPAFNLPAELNDGSWTIGTVTNCAMPQKLFEPNQIYTISSSITENSTPMIVDRGYLGDSDSTKFIQRCSTGKCAALLYYFTHTIRSGQFTIIPQEYFYVFGADHGSSDSQTVCMNSNRLQIQHNNFDDFEIQIDLKRIIV